MITITGGKLTTWRRMAKQTVDRIVERDGSDARCVTQEMPLGMAVAPADLGPRRRRRASSSPAATATSPTTCWRCGRLEPIVAGRPDLLAEVAYAARREQARTVGDVLLRRTRLGLTAARAAARRRERSSASRADGGRAR